MSSSGEQPRAYELEVRIAAPGQPDAVLHREYVTADKLSTDGALGAIWDGVSDDVKSHMRPVADQG